MSKKKIAVLIGGEYRYLDVAIESWKGIINYGCDFYVSTWDTTKPKDKYGILQNNIEITKNMITDLIPTAIVSLLDNTERELLHNISLHNTIKQLYHWKNLIKIIYLINNHILKDKHFYNYIFFIIVIHILVLHPQ
mgnify:CR=1 FL=1